MIQEKSLFNINKIQPNKFNSCKTQKKQTQEKWKKSTASKKLNLVNLSTYFKKAVTSSSLKKTRHLKTLTINGKNYNIDAHDDMPLLWAIRDIIGLTGTKYGCGVSECGACSILIDGDLVRSCSLPVSYGEGKQITTIEGKTDNLEYLRKAWEEINVPQCGYCQSGQLIAATALLDSNSNPTDEDIDVAMSGNICRCGTYPRIRKAIHTAVKLKNK